MNTAGKTDHRKARGDLTRRALMNAAERLMATRGMGNVTIRQIVATAKQKNESALQYHFKNLPGLIAAIHEDRSSQLRARRATALNAALSANPTPSLAVLAALMVEPPFHLAQESPGVRRYIKAFSLEFALEEGSAFSLVSRHGGGGEAGRELGQRLRAALPHLDELRFRQRMEMAVIFCFSALTRHARQPGAFQGPEAESYLRTLTESLTGLLSAP